MDKTCWNFLYLSQTRASKEKKSNWGLVSKMDHSLKDPFFLLGLAGVLQTFNQKINIWDLK